MHKIRLLILLGIAIGSAQHSQASHSMGADLTYRCLGGNSYEIELSFYRDCAGIEADSIADIFFESSCYPSSSIQISLIPGTGQEISPACPNNTTTCNGGTFTGIQEYIYRGVINLPGPCVDWQFSYNLCCRNNAITNIDLPGNTNIYIYANLNNVITPCNNSPTFSNKPVPFACRGQQFCYNHGAYDIDGDSLVYSLITPFDSPGLPITYSSPWSATNPLTSSPAVTLNPQTGDICMTPTNLEITVMAVLVQEFRNGVLIGEVERDIQFTIIDCNNIIPTVSGINGTNSFSQTVCAGTQTCFNINSGDANGTQNTFLDWDYSIPNATFTTFPGQRETATFCWTPTSAQISTNPYCFTVTVRDDNCPFVGSQIYAFCITVTGIITNAGPDLNVGCNATTPITATASGGSGIYSYQWNTGATTQSITGGAGNYIVTASDGSCTDTDTATVQPAPGSPLAAFSNNANCTSLTVQFTDQSSITGGTITNYNWNFGDGFTSTLQNPSHTFSAQGNYQVQLIVTSSTGCIDTLTQNLHLTLNTPNAGFAYNSGCLGAEINFTNQSNSPTPITSVLWYFGDGTTSTAPNASHIYTAAGLYTSSLVITNADGCKDSIPGTLSIFSLPVANAGANDTVCEGLAANLVASGGVSYLWNPGTLTTAAITVTQSASTNYVVIVTDLNGCTSSATARVVISRLPQLNLQDPTICPGATTNLTANIFGGGGGPQSSYTYSWNPGGQTTQQITVGPAVLTNYVVTVTGRYGCVVRDTATVTVDPAIIAFAGLDQNICPGDTATLSADGGTFYQWDQGAGSSQQAFVSPNITTTYTVTVYSAANCTATDQVDVRVLPLPNANAGLDENICIGDSVALNASGGNTYEWSPGNINSQQAVFSPAINSTYAVLVTDANGCKATDSVDVFVNPLPTADAGLNQAICFGTSTTLSATGGTQFLWQPINDTAQTITVSPDSNSVYFLTAIDTNGCRDADSVLVNINQLPNTLMTVNNGLCFGAVNLNAGVSTSGTPGPYFYSWAPTGATTATITGLVPGMYYVTVTDANNCIRNDSAIVDYPTAVSIISSTIPVSCNGGDDGTASAIASGGTAGYTYQWSPAGGQSNVATGLSTGNYIVTATDAYGCTSTTSAFIDEPDPIVLNSTINSVACYGDSTGSININVTGGTTGYSYQWTPSIGTTANVTSLPAGSYSVMVTDLNGCTSTLNNTVLQETPLNLNVATVPTICIGQSADLFAAISGGVSPYSILWNTSDTSALISVSPAFTANYTVTIHDANNCPVTPATVTVSVHPPLNVTTVSIPPLCEGGTVNLQAAGSGGNGGPYYYSWNDSTLFGATPLVLLENDTTFTVTLSDGCSPEVNQSIPVTVYPLPEVDFTPHTISGCTPVEVDFTNFYAQSPGATYYWDLDDGVISNDTNPNHTYITPGQYDISLTIVTTDGCAASQNVNDAVTVFGFPVADFFQSADEVPEFLPSVTFTDNSTDAVSWQWDFGDGNTVIDVLQPTHEYSDSGTYQVRLIVTNEGGCIDTTYGIIRVEPEFTIYVPNSFTPNGDGVNDSFFANGLGFVNYEMWIMDRWGKEIFYSQQAGHHWDGSYFGGDRICQNDVYEYIINVKDYKGKSHKVIGHVSLVR
ncbi:MAG: PKD domain-containing protein [Bacteroidota bacterium]